MDYAVGILLKLSPEQEHIRISHPEKGELLVNPNVVIHSRSISDTAGFFQAHKSSLTVTE